MIRLNKLLSCAISGAKDGSKAPIKPKSYSDAFSRSLKLQLSKSHFTAIKNDYRRCDSHFFIIIKSAVGIIYAF